MAVPDFQADVVDNMTGRPTTPEVLDYNDSLTGDPVRRSPKDSGHVQTSARFTSLPRRYSIRYVGITTQAKNLIYNFEKDTVFSGALEFDWDLPTGGGTLRVRFVGKVMFIPWKRANYTRWIVEFVVETVNGV